MNFSSKKGHHPLFPSQKQYHYLPNQKVSTYLSTSTALKPPHSEVLIHLPKSAFVPFEDPPKSRWTFSKLKSDHVHLRGLPLGQGQSLRWMSTPCTPSSLTSHPPFTHIPSPPALPSLPLPSYFLSLLCSVHAVPSAPYPLPTIVVTWLTSILGRMGDNLTEWLGPALPSHWVPQALLCLPAGVILDQVLPASTVNFLTCKWGSPYLTQNSYKALKYGPGT